VVYDRPKNRFRYKDAARITKSLLDEKDIDPLNLFWLLFWTESNLRARLVDLGWELVELAAAASGSLPDPYDLVFNFIELMIQLSRGFQQRVLPSAFRGSRGLFNPFNPPTISDIQEASSPATHNRWLKGLISVYNDIGSYLDEEGIKHGKD
jgi:hypothetical protein